MDLESIRPKESPRIIDLVTEVGIDTSNWAINEDGTECAVPASNPKYCYEWCFRDHKRKILLLNLWFDETSVEDGVLVQRQNLRGLASTDKASNRRRRAANMDSALRVASMGGWTVRVMIMDGKNESDAKQKASARMLDPNPWRVEKYDEETGDCILVREGLSASVQEMESKTWSQEELRALVGAYVEMRDKQLAGETFLKEGLYRRLAEQFGRAEKSLQDQMQVISHVFAQQGRQWIKGLRPARNVGANKTKEIEALLAEVEGTSHSDAASFYSTVDDFRRKGLPPPSGSRVPGQSENISTTYNRDPQVIAWILNEADGTCESCGSPAPFVKSDGS
ncbi:hypothetical protein [Bowmanella dokdonensis]|uniref:Uncharacterized protein n=1 Tax=Bowmanella dokdonensis TaxID=751969 RepID=A0A939DSE9_9ALTE|nr:hypothetical protein [Bowmanella dokdonensis]MBN7827365.1 hypothetical protein [Bowmanella dokdonensis]